MRGIFPGKTDNLTITGGDILKEKPEKPERIVTDPYGSYTGRPKHGEQQPVQDADDL